MTNLPRPPSWYDRIMADDAMLGPDFAEEKYYSHEWRPAPQLSATGRLILPAPDPLSPARAAVMGAFMDALLERRPYSLIPKRRGKCPINLPA